MRIATLFAVLVLACAATLARPRQSATGAASATHAAKLPEDQHGGLAISVDAYSDAARSKDKFGKAADPVPAGILPVEVFIRNTTSGLIHVNLRTIQLEVQFPSGGHQNVDALTVREVAAAIVHPAGAASPTAPRLPIHIPLPGKDKKVDKVVDALSPLFLDADIVPPQGSIHGFVFFNMNHEIELAPAASLYVPDVTLVPSNQALMFFEVPLTAGVSPTS